MRATTDKRLLVVWIGLSAITLLSWWWGSARMHPWHIDAAVTFGVILAAAVKVRLILREFMEVRRAGALIAWLTDLWLFGVIGLLLAVYVSGIGYKAPEVVPAWNIPLGSPPPAGAR